MTVTIGTPAPDFTLPASGGTTVSLSQFRGKKVIVYFYPKDDTPGCTKEACGFRDALPDFTGSDAVVIGISKDSVASHDKFRGKYDLPFLLAADTEGSVAESFGSWVEKQNYGKRYMGLDRSTFLIDRDGLVREIWRKVKVDGHVEKVLEAAKALL
jgi:peroxiredoxin Q/BCP